MIQRRISGWNGNRRSHVIKESAVFIPCDEQDAGWAESALEDRVVDVPDQRLTRRHGPERMLRIAVGEIDQCRVVRLDKRVRRGIIRLKIGPKLFDRSEELIPLVDHAAQAEYLREHIAPIHPPRRPFRHQLLENMHVIKPQILARLGNRTDVARLPKLLSSPPDDPAWANNRLGHVGPGIDENQLSKNRLFRASLTSVGIDLAAKPCKPSPVNPVIAPPLI